MFSWSCSHRNALRQLKLRKRNPDKFIQRGCYLKSRKFTSNKTENSYFSDRTQKLSKFETKNARNKDAQKCERQLSQERGTAFISSGKACASYIQFGFISRNALWTTYVLCCVKGKETSTVTFLEQIKLSKKVTTMAPQRVPVKDSFLEAL